MGTGELILKASRQAQWLVVGNGKLGRKPADPGGWAAPAQAPGVELGLATPGFAGSFPAP